MSRTEQLADAFEAIAHVNHYIVGLTEAVTDDELDGAEDILITRQHVATMNSTAYKRLDLAIDLIEAHRRASRSF